MASSASFLTPDGDIFGEQVSGGNMDFLVGGPSAADGSAPFWTILRVIYDFSSPLYVIAKPLLIAEGEAHANAEGARLGLPPPLEGAALPAVAAAGAVAASPVGHLPAAAPHPSAGSLRYHGGPALQGGVLHGGLAAVGTGADAGGGLAALAGAIVDMDASHIEVPVADVHDDAMTLPILIDDVGPRLRDFRDGARRC
jgi:hypothetical protein